MNNIQKEQWSIFGAVSAAVAASACCTIPLLLVSLGIGGAWMSSLTALEPFRPLFIGVAMGLIGFAFGRNVTSQTASACDCEEPMAPRTKTLLLTVGLIVTLGLLVSPLLIRPATSAADMTLSPPSLQTVTLNVEQMTCAGCTQTVTKALTRLEGVDHVKVIFTPPEAIVTYHASRVAPEDFVKATTDAGYPSSLKITP